MLTTLMGRIGRISEIFVDEFETLLIAILLCRYEIKLRQLEKAKKRKQERISKSQEEYKELQDEYDSFLDAYLTLKRQWGVDSIKH